MASIKKAHAFCNNEVGFVAWRSDVKIPGCLGFMLVRVILNNDGSERSRHVLPTWVAFKGQSNPDWEPQDTSVWPVQKFSWRDLTLRRLRDALVIRDPSFRCFYEITPVGRSAPGRPPVLVAAGMPAYEGTPVPLFQCEPPVRTNEILVTGDFGDVTVAFNNGILSTQNLRKQLGTVGDKPPSKSALLARLRAPGDDVREFLAGDVLRIIRALFQRAEDEDLLMFAALYELSDKELIDLLKANAARLHLILSTAGKTEEDGVPVHWDTTNEQARHDLRALIGARLQDRMFNNTAHIGHNKFVVLTTQQRKPIAVFTGSTNWTSTGVGGQTNNALLIESEDMGRAYLDYWDRLQSDPLPVPSPIFAQNSTVQGQPLRTANRTATGLELDGAATKAAIWFSPNTKRVSKGTALPVDLAEVFAAIDGAKQAIFLLCFNPGRPSIIDQSLLAATARPDLLVSGAISEPTALPGYVKPPAKEEVTLPDGRKITIPSPAIYSPVVAGQRLDRVMMIRAAALRGRVGDFRGELLTTGNAIIHDKMLVIDPLSADDCVVVTGSHNLGYKASYCNDENLLILRGHRALATAYAVHVMDIFDHYRFRAVQEERWLKALKETGKPPVEDNKGGFLRTNDAWQNDYLNGTKGRELNYFLS